MFKPQDVLSCPEFIRYHYFVYSRYLSNIHCVLMCKLNLCIFILLKVTGKVPFQQVQVQRKSKSKIRPVNGHTGVPACNA